MISKENSRSYQERPWERHCRGHLSGEMSPLCDSTRLVRTQRLKSSSLTTHTRQFLSQLNLRRKL